MLALTLLSAGCGAGTRAAGTSEEAWLAAYGRWWSAFHGDLSETLRLAHQVDFFGGADPDVIEKLTKEIVSVRDCAETFGAQVPKAPTKRLADVARLTRENCRHIDRAGAALASSLISYSDYDTLFTVWDRQYAAFARGADTVRRRLARASPRLARSLAVPDAGLHTGSSIDLVYSRVASHLAGSSVVVRCWTKKAWPRLERELEVAGVSANTELAGYANRTGGNGVNLAPDVCADLDALSRAKAEPTGGERLLRAAFAVLVLAHESAHVRGLDREAEAECWGMQNVVRTATELGLPAAYGRRLADVYWTEIYPHQRPGYRTTACRDGGSLDLHPNRSVWP